MKKKTKTRVQPIMVKKWGISDIIHLDSALLVVVGHKRPVCGDAKDNSTSVHIINNTVYDGGREEGLGFRFYCHLYRRVLGGITRNK
jgi:hypothetical protein